MRNNDLIDAHVTYLIGGGYSARTIGEARKVLTRLDRDLPHGLATVVPADLDAWQATPVTWRRPRSGTRSVQTKATYRDHIVRFYRWAANPADPWLDADPSVGLRRPKIHRGVPHPATDDEVTVAVTALRWPWRLHCVLAAYEGLRPCEIATLRAEHVTQANVAVYGKGAKPAVVPTHPVVWATIAGLPDGPVTRNTTGAEATAQWVSMSTRHQLHRHGARVSLRALRHWYGTTLLAGCHDLRVVQECMRHESVETTQVYTQVVDAQLRAAVGLLPTLTGGVPDGSGGRAARAA